MESTLLPESSLAQTPTTEELIVRGLEFYRTGNCPKAKPLLEEILRRQPKDIAVRKLLGTCFLRESKWGEARLQFQLALDAAPQDGDALKGLQVAVSELQKREQLRQALAIESRAATAEELRASQEFEEAMRLMKAGQLNDAELILKDLARRHPGSIPARQRLAEIYSATRRYAMAAEIYRELAAQADRAGQFTLRLAQNLEWNGQHREAARTYQLYLRRRPDNWTARRALANLLFWSGRYREAIPELERLQQHNPTDVEVQLALAQCYHQVSALEQALHAYARVLELDPTNPAALRAHTDLYRYFDELPRQRAFAELEQGHYEAAARHFVDYLQRHPESVDTMLQIARTYSWGQQSTLAEHYYERYLERRPDSDAARRELAQIQLWARNYPGAQNHFKRLVESGAATAEDLEHLVQAYVWEGNVAGALPYAQKLAKSDPANPVAQRVLSDYAEQQRILARTRADELAAAGRFTEAVAAYQRYMQSYGQDARLQLLICRLYSWAGQYDESANACREYLREHPADLDARLELARVLNWSGHYDAAEAEYRAVLAKDPTNLVALLGLAQVLDYRGDDPFRVRRGFRRVLAADPSNSLARERIDALHSQLAPALRYRYYGFLDSDGFLRSAHTVEGTVSLPGRAKLAPFYSVDYFRQHRTVAGTSPPIQLLNARISELGGTILSHGVGMGAEWSPSSRWSWAGRLSGHRFDSARSSVQASVELTLWPGRGRAVGLSYVHRDAVNDLNTLASLVAGIMQDAVSFSYRQPLNERWSVWAAGGAAHYSAGNIAGFRSNTQGRLSALLAYQIHSSLRLGYSLRMSHFAERAPFYFSPSLYQTHGLAYAFDHRFRKDSSLAAEGEVNYGRIDGISTVEFAVAPRVNLHIRPGLVLRAGYRFSRSRAGAFGSPKYRTHGIEVTLSKTL